MLYQRKGSPYWWSDVSHPALPRGRARQSTEVPFTDQTGNFTDKELRQRAQEWEDRFKASLWNRPLGKEHTFYEACAKWLITPTKYQRERGAPDIYVLSAIKEIYPDRALSEATVESFDDVLSGISDATYNRRLSILSGIFKVANDKWGSAIPRFKWKTIPKGPKRRAMSAKEVEKLLPELPQHQKQIAEFALATGQRRHNVTHLQWTQVDLESEIPMLYLDAEDMKNNHDFGTPLSAKAVRILKEQQGLHPVWIFPYRDRPITSLKTAFKKACKRVGISNVTPCHGYRHTWTSTMLMNGVPKEVVQKLGNWKTPDMVDNYFHPSPSYLANFADYSDKINTRNKKSQLKTRHTSMSQKLKRAA